MFSRFYHNFILQMSLLNMRLKQLNSKTLDSVSGEVLYLEVSQDGVSIASLPVLRQEVKHSHGGLNGKDQGLKDMGPVTMANFSEGLCAASLSLTCFRHGFDH